MTDSSRDPLTIAALGSSFGSGPGIDPQTDALASRSGANYPSLLAARLRAAGHVVHLTDVTFAGATLANLLDTPQTNAMGVPGFAPPQLEGVSADADVVTITAAGNDLRYVGGMMQDAGALGMRLNVVSAQVREMLEMFAARAAAAAADGVPDAPASEDETVALFKTVIRAVKQRAPGARIVLVEYLTLLGDDARGHDAPTGAPNVLLTPEQIETHRAIAAVLSRVYARAAEGEEGVSVLDVARASAAHGVGSEEPWVNGWNLGEECGDGMAFHPNKKGMEAVAELLEGHLRALGLI